MTDPRQRIVDLSHPIHEGMPTYPGLPGPVITDYLTREASRASYAPGTEFQIGRITLVANTGTYVDAPFHRYADGADLAALSLERLADLEGLVIDLRGAPERGISREQLLPYRVEGRAILLRTGWSRHWGTDAYASGHPFLTREGARLLVERRPALVGIDSLNIDDTADGTRPAHSLLLGAGIPLCEHLTGLEGLPTEGFRFSAVPVPVRGMGTFPVRAYALLAGAGGMREQAG
jgi:kynurenine formamidase